MAEVIPDVPVLYPPIYPYSFFQSQRFKSSHTKPIAYLPLDGADVQIFSSSPLLQSRLIADFDRIMFERAGIMLGEYVVLDDGLFIMDRTGNCVSINFPWDSALMARMPYVAVNDPAFWDVRQRLIDTWDTIPIVDKATVFSHIYYNNYYHFTFEFLQNVRLVQSFDIDRIIIPPLILGQPFQRDLLSRAMGERGVIAGGRPIRAINPVVLQTYQSLEGLHWLRQTMKFPTRPGRNRYYIRRTPKVKRRGNNIAESPEFLAFLARHKFKTIDFGNGENSVADQIAMLDKASVILAAHGAGLTNIAYLKAPLALIEVFSRSVLSASFMQLCIALDFAYRGIISETIDDDGGIVTDIDELDAIMRGLPG